MNINVERWSLFNLRKCSRNRIDYRGCTYIPGRSFDCIKKYDENFVLDIEINNNRRVDFVRIALYKSTWTLIFMPIREEEGK